MSADFASLQLSPGAQVKLVAGDSTQTPVKARYVGCLAPQFVLVAVPAKVVGPILRAGVKVAVSVFTPTGIATFSATVEGAVSQPFALVHLRYPTALALRSVRQAPRVAVELPLQVINLEAVSNREVFEAHLLDLSVRGARFGAAREIGQIGDEISMRVQLAFDDIYRDVAITARIRARPVADGVSGSFPQVYGVEFSAVDEERRILLHAFVLNLLWERGAQI
jgi:hypothetical protein